MKAAMLYEYDEEMNVELKLETVPDPTIKAADEVIVRVGAAGLCRTDLHIVEGVWKDLMDPEGALLPYIMGHENAGVGRGGRQWSHLGEARRRSDLPPLTHLWCLSSVPSG